MMFLIKVVFWLMVVVVLLPLGDGGRKHEVGARDALNAAQATISDVRGFCGRQPEACAVGVEALNSVGDRAQAGAKLLYDLLSDKAETKTPPAPLRGTLEPAETLTPADQAVPWRGPDTAPLPRRRPA